MLAISSALNTPDRSGDTTTPGTTRSVVRGGRLSRQYENESTLEWLFLLNR
jgi:hypothetical protein